MISIIESIGILCYRATLIMAPSRWIVQEMSTPRIAGFLLLSSVLIISFAIPPFRNSEFTVCLFKNIFGIPCPGCGMTRAFLFIAHGDIRSALELNVNSLAVFVVVVALWAQSAFHVITGKKIRIHLERRENYFVFVVAVVAMMSGWVYNLSR